MHRRLLPGLLLIALAAAHPAVHAQDEERRYDVEIIVFEHTDTSEGEQERWRPQVHEPEFHKVILFEDDNGDFRFLTDEDREEDEDDEDIEAPEGYRRLSSERLQLDDLVEKLDDSDDYRVLRHLRWRQPDDDRDRAVPVRIHAGEPITVYIPIRHFEELYRLEEEAEETDGDIGVETDDADPLSEDDERDEGETFAADDPDDTSGIGVESGGAETFATGPGFRSRLQPLMRPTEIHPLDGTVRVAVSRYLHVTTDLHFTTAVEWTAEPGRKPQEDEENGQSDPDEDDDKATLDPAPTGEIARNQHAIADDGRTVLSYPFRQSRRMRSGELHYLDHPVLGLLIRVDRAPEEDDEG